MNGFLKIMANYPANVPKDFMGWSIKLSTIYFKTILFVTGKYSQNDGSTAYEVTGLSVEMLKSVCEKMNLTNVLPETQQSLNSGNALKSIVEIEDGLSDVLIRPIPLMPVVVASSFDATIPYFYNTIKIFVPCPKAIRGTDKILTTFSLSVWLTIGLVLLLTATVFWCAGNGLCIMRHTHINHCPTLSKMLGLFL